MRTIVSLALFAATAAAWSPALHGPGPHAASDTARPLRPATADSLGARTVASICMACHTMQGPPNAAPAFAMIAARYRAASASTDEAAARMVRYVRNPAADSSLLPAMAIERFGLMPALMLPDSALLAAAHHVLESGTAPRGHGRGHR